MPLDPADFTAEWSPMRKGITWATVTHTPSGRSFRLKAAKCVTDLWAVVADRTAWLRAQAMAYLTRVLYNESAEGIREGLIEQTKGHRDSVRAAMEFCEQVKFDYPAQAHRVPTITVTGGDN